MLRATVASIQEKNPDCTLEYVEQEIVKEIDVRTSIGDGSESEY